MSTDWKARAEAAEARVMELEEALIGADKHAATVEGLLSHHVSWDGITPQGCAQSITVTDEMVERAKKAITETLLALHESDDAWVGEVTSNSLTVDGLVNVERLARAALTAALENRND